MIMKLWATLLILLLATGCANTVANRVDDSRRDTVHQTLDAFGQGYRQTNWASVQQFFSPGYYGGYEELRNKLENKWRNERVLDIQFRLNRILESDGLFNVQVRWEKSYQDNTTGSILKASGLSELILESKGNSFRILKVDGDQFF